MLNHSFFTIGLKSRFIQMTKANIVIPEKDMIESKEALFFAFLGPLKEKKVKELSSITGAKKEHSSGQNFIPKN